MRPLLLLLVSLFSIACATTRPLAPQKALPTPALGDRMIVEVTSGEVLPLAPVVRDLRTVNHLYVGERHAVPGYQDTQLEVVRALDSAGAHIGIGVEWLPMETQGTVDAFIAGELTESEFMKKVNWKHLWGHNFEAYRPIFRFAQRRKIPIWALGAPHGLARAVGRHGVRRLPTKWKKYLPPLNTKNRAHREFFEAMMSAVAHAHRGHHGHNKHHRHKHHQHRHKHHQHRHKHHQPHTPPRAESMMDRYYTAQVLRDEYMAQNLKAHLEKPENNQRIAVVFAGIGHTDFALGIPLRAARLLGSPFRIILPIPNGAMDDHARLVRNKPYPRRRADYLWEAPTHRPRLVTQGRIEATLF